MAFGDIPFQIKLWGLQRNPQPDSKKYDDIITIEELESVEAGRVFAVLGLQQRNAEAERPEAINGYIFNSETGRDIFTLDLLPFDSNSAQSVENFNWLVYYWKYCRFKFFSIWGTENTFYDTAIFRNYASSLTPGDTPESEDSSAEGENEEPESEDSVVEVAIRIETLDESEVSYEYETAERVVRIEVQKYNPNEPRIIAIADMPKEPESEEETDEGSDELPEELAALDEGAGEIQTGTLED